METELTVEITEPGVDAARFETWAIVEIMGHRKVAGRVSERRIAGNDMLCIDVPASPGVAAQTKYYGGAAIFAIHLCSEEMARATAAQLAKSWQYGDLHSIAPQLPPDIVFGDENFVDDKPASLAVVDAIDSDEADIEVDAFDAGY